MFQLYIFLALVLNCLIILIAVYIVEKKIKDMEQLHNNRWTYVEDMAEKNETDISHLYKEDEHETLRPKVDILRDFTNVNSENIWEKLEEIYKELNEPVYPKVKK